MLTATCILVFLSLWIDKGLGLIVGGFIPSSLGAITEYTPTVPEMLITLGIWSLGLLMITVFYKITLSVREALDR
jgi:molybdopterin-containing oxidoreductase family membrane subunit